MQLKQDWQNWNDFITEKMFPMIDIPTKNDGGFNFGPPSPPISQLQEDKTNDFEFIGNLIDEQINLINSNGILEPYIEPIIFPKTEQVIDVFPSEPLYTITSSLIIRAF